MSPGYETKHSGCVAPNMELWRMKNTSSLPLHIGQLWSRVVVPVRVLAMGQIEQFKHLLYLKPFNCVQTNNLYQTESLVLAMHEII